MGRLKQLTGVLNPRGKHELRIVVSTPMYVYLVERAAELGFSTVSEFVRHLIAQSMEKEAKKEGEKK